MAQEREKYLYLTAMLRAREVRLLTRERAMSMLDAPTFDDAARILTDCGYEDMSGMKAGEIDSVLNRRREEVFAETARLSPETALVDIFRIRYDYHNVKAIIKARAMEVDAEYLLSRSGRVEPEKLTAACREGKNASLPKALGTAVREAESVLARTANPQMSDFVLDAACFAELKECAAQTENAFVEKYVSALIDCANIKGSVRTLRMGKSPDFMADVLVDGGTVSRTRFLTADSGDAIAALFANTHLEKAAQLGAEAINGGSMTTFELECDNVIVRLLREAGRVSYGCEPLLAYLAAIENETTAVRMILNAKLAGIHPQVIKERLRELYA